MQKWDNYVIASFSLRFKKMPPLSNNPHLAFVSYLLLYLICLFLYFRERKKTVQKLKQNWKSLVTQENLDQCYIILQIISKES